MRQEHRLAEHTKELTTLKVSDVVMMQNQSGLHPLKWDKSGTVVEVLPFNQCKVKMDGSGRVSLRNRKFLKPISPYTTGLPWDLTTGLLAVTAANMLPFTSVSPTTTLHQPSQTVTDMELLEDRNQAEDLPTESMIQEDTLGRGEEMLDTEESHGALGYQEHHAPGPHKSGRTRRMPQRLEDYKLGGLHTDVQNPPRGGDN